MQTEPPRRTAVSYAKLSQFVSFLSLNSKTPKRWTQWMHIPLHGSGHGILKLLPNALHSWCIISSRCNCNVSSSVHCSSIHLFSMIVRPNPYPYRINKYSHNDNDTTQHSAKRTTENGERLMGWGGNRKCIELAGRSPRSSCNRRLENVPSIGARRDIETEEEPKYRPQKEQQEAVHFWR